MSKDRLLTKEEQSLLLSLARDALEKGVAGVPLPTLDHERLPEVLLEDGASFVTLTIGGNLRGCIGSLEPYQPLAEDVREHAIAAALKDYRFPPVESSEVDLIQIEISRLTRPQPLLYQDAEDLLEKLRPGIDGVVLNQNWRRATFLPQVWEKIPNPEDFLGHLCQKMGVPLDTWKEGGLEVFTYQVEEFHES